MSGRKFGIAAYSATTMSGLVVAKRDVPDLVDIRNVSIAPEVRRRAFGVFAIRQLLHTVKTGLPEVRKIRVDTKPTNTGMIAFLKGLGFESVGLRDLYSSGNPDLVLARTSGGAAGVADDLLL